MATERTEDTSTVVLVHPWWRRARRGEPGPRRPGRRRAAVALAGLAVVTVIATAWALTRSGPVDDRMLVVDEEGTVSLVDPLTGEALYEVPGATATPDRSALLTTQVTAGSTVLHSHDPRTGQVTGSTTLDGELAVRTVSPTGTAVALMPGTPGPGLYEPVPRTRTSLTVSYLDDRPPRTYDLAGNIEPEMFSYDEGGLFVLEFDPPTDPSGYFVRRLDLATGELDDTGAPEVTLNPRMRGKARAQVLHPEGTFLYTLYTLPSGEAPVYDPDGDDTPRRAFIHVIDLREEASYCIFLDGPIGTRDEPGIGLGIAPDGRQLLVADPTTSTVARVDAVDLEVLETRRVEQLRDTGHRATLAVAGDGRAYLGSGGVVLELDPTSLQPVFAWSAGPAGPAGPADLPGPVSGLSVSASGEDLRVAAGGRITILDRATRQERAVLQPPGRGTVALLGPPSGSVVEFPLECAC